MPPPVVDGNGNIDEEEFARMYQIIYPFLPHELHKQKRISNEEIIALANVEYQRDAPQGVMGRISFKLSFFELAGRVDPIFFCTISN